MDFVAGQAAAWPRFRRPAASGPALGAGLIGVLATGAAPAQWTGSADCATLGLRLVGIPKAEGARCSGGEDAWDQVIDASQPGTVFVVRHPAGRAGNFALPPITLPHLPVAVHLPDRTSGGSL